MNKKDKIVEEATGEIDQDRRKAQSRMGLAASVTYATPVLMTLSSSIKAQDAESIEQSEPCEPGS